MLYLLILQFLVLDDVQSHVLDKTQTVKISAQFHVLYMFNLYTCRLYKGRSPC